MSKRAEEAALEAYPVNMQYSTVYDCVYDLAQIERKKFLKVYEQAEKETIERAVAWLKDYVKYFEIYDEKGIEEFKKAMEEEI